MSACPSADQSGEAGMISAFVLALLLALLAVVGLALDPGLALAAKLRALGQAEEAARAGAQQIDLRTYRITGTLRLDPAQAAAAARRFLTQEHATGTVQVTDTDVTVTITAAYRTQLWELVGISTLTIHATGSAQPQLSA